jgi:Ca2+-binding EF-hand superfamily protein
MDAARILYGRADTNNDRTVSLNEFIPLYRKVHPKAQVKGWGAKEWRQLFNVYDKNRDQRLTWNEFYAVSKFRQELNNK